MWSYRCSQGLASWKLSSRTRPGKRLPARFSHTYLHLGEIQATSSFVYRKFLEEIEVFAQRASGDHDCLALGIQDLFVRVGDLAKCVEWSRNISNLCNLIDWPISFLL